MKDYYLFPDEGTPIKIEIKGNNFTFNLKDDIQVEVSQTQDSVVVKQNRVRSSFSKENLIKQLETLLNNVKKKV